MGRPERQCRVLKFSHRVLEALPPPPPDCPSSNLEYSDAVESGLRLAVYKSGKKSWRQRYSILGIKKTMTLGSFPAVSLERARERVRENKALLAEDIDPLDAREKIRNTPTLQEFVEESFLPLARHERKAMRDVTSRLNVHVIPAFGTRQLNQISRRDVMLFHQRQKEKVSNTTANRSLSLLSSIMRLAVEMEYLGENPCHGVKKAKEPPSRKRVLSGEELPRFMAALVKAMATLSGKALYMLIATGLRKSEVLSLAWDNLDLEQGRGFIPDPKNGIPRYVGLNSLAVEILAGMAAKRGESSWVFPSPSAKGHLLDVRKTFASICRKAKVQGLRIHDIRRSVASYLCDSGQNLVVVRDLLGHSDVRTTQGYVHLEISAQQAAGEVTATRLRRALDIAA